MIDGIKAILSDNLEVIRNSALLDFQLTFRSSVLTGEIKPGRNKYPSAIFKSLVFEDKGSVIEVRGSIHKMQNKGKHNFDQFGLSRIHLALYELADQLSIITNHAVLRNIEFGVNLLVEFEPKVFLNSLILHKSKMFTYRIERNMKYRECSHAQYYIKVYDKGMQYGLNQNILRFELKFIKMEKINQLGIRVLSDLLNPEKLERLRTELLRIYDEILISDITKDHTSLSQKEQVLFASGNNANFWIAQLPSSINYSAGAADKKYKKDLKAYQRKMVRFKKLLQEVRADKMKNLVRKKIEVVSSGLLQNTAIRSYNPVRCPELTNRSKGHFITKVSKIDRHKNHNKLSRIDRLLYSDNNMQDYGNPERKCIVTGLNISMQKEGSRFLCTSGIEHYMKQQPNIWEQLKKRLSPKWKNSPIEIQIEQLHQSIRNEHFNRIHNTRRSIMQITSHPALFNQFELISKEKLVIAGFGNH